MSTVGEIERKTQQRLIKLFQDFLGYEYLGDWTDRLNNRNIEPELLKKWLKKRNISDFIISRVLDKLEKAAGDTSKSF